LIRKRQFAAHSIILLLALLLSACVSPETTLAPEIKAEQAQSLPAGAATPEILLPAPTFPSRPRYSPAELVDYTVQCGDTLPNLAARFNTSIEQIQEANSFIPLSATTLPPGMPMKIPIYYLPFWGSPYQILPDSLFVNGPSQRDFDTSGFVNSHPGWLKGYTSYVSDVNRSGAEIVDLVARNFSLSPRLLLALLEYKAGALSQTDVEPEVQDYPLGVKEWRQKGLFLQLTYVANLLNDGYYRFRQSRLLELEHSDGTLERVDPWQNAATVSLQNYFNTLLEYDDYLRAISPEGFARIYQDLFGDPWQDIQPHIPVSLVQPEFILPFEPGEVWAYTGGPHTAYGRLEPYAAIDFAPPSVGSGCLPSDIWATAVAPGTVVRSGDGEVMLDLDNDGDERTGWNIFYLHVATEGRAQLGAILRQGERVGHPSCEGGQSTGTHVHIARKYNGEWIPSEGYQGIMAFNLEGWIAHNGSRVYLGTLTRNSQVVTACTCSNAASFIQSDRPVTAQK